MSTFTYLLSPAWLSLKFGHWYYLFSLGPFYGKIISHNFDLLVYCRFWSHLWFVILKVNSQTNIKAKENQIFETRNLFLCAIKYNKDLVRQEDSPQAMLLQWYAFILVFLSTMTSMCVPEIYLILSYLREAILQKIPEFYEILS